MSGVWAGLALIATIFGCGAITLTISYRANARRDATRQQYAADIHDVWGDSDWDDEDDQAPGLITTPGPLDDTYQQLEAMYHAPAAERRQP